MQYLTKNNCVTSDAIVIWKEYTNYKQISLLKILLQQNRLPFEKKYEKRKGLFLKHEYIGFSDFAR